MLKELVIKSVYDAEEDNILKDFYIPVLSQATSYDRAVGYFDAKVLTAAARGLNSFVENGGHIRLIVGATLNEEEYEAIAAGYEGRSTVERISEAFEESLNFIQEGPFRNQLSALTWFVQNQRLDVKVALRRAGIYHEKVGIIRDKDGNEVVFQGSANETNNALAQINYESINVFKGWIPEFRDHIDPHIKKFEVLWANRAKNTRVLDFTEITKNILTNKLGTVDTPIAGHELKFWQNYFEVEQDEKTFNTEPFVPRLLNGSPFNLKPHQRTALNNWKENNFRGIFELATGAGKTITSIYGAVKLYESRKKLFLVISVPYQSLADQWSDNLNVFNIKPLVCYGGEAQWREKLSKQVINFQMGFVNFSAAVVVDATLSSKAGTFLEIINSLGDENASNLMFVGDECHHHGSKITFDSLPKNASYRMGLSATPDREDILENASLEEYYGKVVSSYTLENALDDGVLTPYEYHLHEVSLTSDECDQYVTLSKDISRMIAMSKGASSLDISNNSLNSLLRKRARLISGCQNKPKVLESLLSKMSPIKHSLFYCAEGKLDDGEEEDARAGQKQIQVISELLYSLNWRSSQFTANEDRAQRERILSSFKEGQIDSLVAMKCLDEGIDVPACSTAFILASSRQSRQFIQRRGRILRRSEGKEKAIIYDFFVTLPVGILDDDRFERRLLIAELKRIDEFAKLSLNKGQTYKQLESYLRKYDLIHYLT